MQFNLYIYIYKHQTDVIFITILLIVETLGDPSTPLQDFLTCFLAMNMESHCIVRSSKQKLQLWTRIYINVTSGDSLYET